MTVSSSSVKEFSRTEILRRALQKAGLLNVAQNPSSTHPAVSAAADALELVLSQLQSEGVILHTTDFASLALTAGQASTSPFTLPAATLDVTGTAMLLQGASPTSETRVDPMGAEDWQAITDKTALGVPTRYYVHRLLSVQLYLWPGVDSAAASWTLRYRQVRLLRGIGTDAGTTMDLPRYWQQYLVYATAHELMVDAGMPTERCGYVRNERERLKKVALNYGAARGPIQMHYETRRMWR